MIRYSFGFIGLLIALLILAIFSFPDRNLHVIFCDVGQGDAILASFGTVQILVDGGPDSSINGCLGRHLPFWDRKIEVVIVTHPQEDHFTGVIDVVRRYKVGLFLHPGVEGSSAAWGVLKEELKKRSVVQKIVSSGNKIRYASLYFDILYPPREFIGSDPNEYSIVGTLSFGEFDVLLTGDITPGISDQLALPSSRAHFMVTQWNQTEGSTVKEVEVLKVPHHGSKNGLTNALLEKTNPKLALITVGKNNRYGHPHPEVIKLLSEKAIKILRTDLDGEVEVVSDGKRWWVKGMDSIF